MFFLTTALLTLMGLTTAAPTTNINNARDITAPALGVAIDICKEFNYVDCYLNLHLDDNTCTNLNMHEFAGAKGLSSIRFGGNMYCALHEKINCEDGGGSREHEERAYGLASARVMAFWFHGARNGEGISWMGEESILRRQTA
ncbi:hypothetical protein EJ08DRAFT_662652 [Tothia fuscella]|uniref:Uncharacterized protein n=1 Tax=Tothia fuscella TaxID=1048955 RepID=A0A9P4TWY5_9PEZI|nr:hypothetical protein EJ08DRAFT_662652 [Tothia fuscella]